MSVPDSAASQTHRSRAVALCPVCHEANRTDLDRLDLARCHTCAHPLACPDRTAQLECPSCRASIGCSVLDEAPSCPHCGVLTRVNLLRCDKCGAHTSAVLAHEVWSEVGGIRSVLGRVCGACRNGWLRFTRLDVTAGLPSYLPPLARAWTAAEKDLHVLHNDGWDRWLSERQAAAS